MAHKLPNGDWRAEVRLPNGKRVTRTDPLKRVVVAWAEQQRTASRRGQWRDPRDAKVTVTDWHTRWWAARLAGAKTLQRNAEVWRLHVQPQWGTWPLDAITRMEVQGWAKQELAKGKGIRTVEQSVSLLSMLMQAALDEDPPILTGRNPCRGVVAELPEAPQRPPTYFTPEQYRAILDHAGPFRDLIDFAMVTGLRWGELAGLRVGNVDRLHQLVHVQWVIELGQPREYPKSRRSRRAVPIPAHFKDRMGELVKGRPADAPVFCRPDVPGERLDYDRFVTAWDNAVTKARTCAPSARCGGPDACRDTDHHAPAYSPHSMRHTSASWLVQSGVDLMRVQKLLGHESYVTTQRYAHLAPNVNDQVRDVWAVILGATQMTHGAAEPGAAGPRPMT
jgi:integrase